MHIVRFLGGSRSLLYCGLIICISGVMVFLLSGKTGSGVVSAQTSAATESVAATFQANPATLGAIPDGPDTCNGPGPARNVTFTVSGLTGPPTNVSVTVTLNPPHTWVGDLDAILIAPDGSTFHYLFTFTGGTPTGGSDGSSAGGPYIFNDAASGNWWSAAAAVPDDPDSSVIPAGSYRTSDINGNLTLMNPKFAAIPTSNGTWTLRFLDFCLGDTGSVSSASLTLATAANPQTHTVGDFDGDGSTDFTVVRNTGGGINGQVTWFVNKHADGSQLSRQWGLASDTFLANDFDGDGLADYGVWRQGIQSTFYIIQSQTNTIRVQDWGISNDDPSVVGDYDNDGKADFAVYRPGTTPGAQSFWYWKPSASSTQFNVVAWGLTDDTPAPGDYDGDHKMDFAVQRANGGNSDFYRRYSSGIADTVTTLGHSTDYNVPGDYDGDGKTDLCVVGITGSPSLLQWTYRPSGGGADVVDTWGFDTDYPAPGDYNGDGKADYAVWRPGALSTFWVMRPVTRQIESRQWGLIDDVPVQYTYAH